MRYSVLLIAWLAVGSACHDNPSAVYPTVVSFDESKLILGPQDKLNLTVYYGSKSITALYTLDASGQIDVQFIGAVTAGGKTVGQVRDEIKRRLADGYLKNPIVSLTIVELNSLSVSVSGMVSKTGKLKFTPGMSIIDVIAMSGGFTPLARKNMVRVTRLMDGERQTYKLPVEMMSEGERPKFPMLPGDDVFVPERAW